MKTAWVTWALRLAVLLATCPVAWSGSTPESFHEELLLKPLPNGDLLAHFRFTTLKPDGGTTCSSARHFRLFPRFLAELVEAHALEELDLSLSRGVWREALMGYHPRNWGSPPGAKVQAWFQPGLSQTDVDKNWSKLTNALSGQLCASINFLDSTTSVSPKFSCQPSGISALDSETASNRSTSASKLGLLPKENVCTENLTPWKKLLPCEAKRGLATLLNAASIHRTKHHSLGISLRKVCPQGQEECASPSLEFVQDVTLVFSPHIFGENQKTGPSSWSIRTLFGIGLTSTCPMAETSRIFYDITDDLFALQLPEGVKAKIQKVDGRTFKVVDLEALLQRGLSNVVANYRQPMIYGLIPSPVLHASRYLVGHGQEKGGIVTKVTNKHSQALSIIYLDVIPWYLRTYLHTLKIQTEQGVELKPYRLEFSPGRDRERPYVMELVLTLPPKSVTQISISFEKSILKWLEYPPDANHGFYVNSAMITAVLPSRRNLTHPGRFFNTFTQMMEDDESAPNLKDRLVRIYTEGLLVNLPTPDFSMPYNVICLACTVVALAFGPLHNITTKNLQLETQPDSPGLLTKIKRKFLRLIGKGEPKSTETIADDNEEKAGDSEENIGQIKVDNDQALG